MSLPPLLEPEQLLPLLEREDVLIIDVCSAERFAQGHIPGALHVLPGQLQGGEKPAVGALPGVDALSALFSGLGLERKHHVVATDDEGGGWAGRLLWTLDCLGHSRHSLLNGGTVAWAADDHPLSRDPASTTPSDYRATLSPGAPLTSLGELRAQLGSPDLGVWDARSREEFEGTRVLAARGGHIPGAAHLEWTELMDRQRDLRLLPLEQIQAMLAARGLTPDKRIVTHCQTHHRSGLTYVVGRLLGYPDITAYDGSWSEWGNRDDTPVEVGPAP